MSQETQTRLAENLGSVRTRIQSACERAGRQVDDVTLVAVTKYAEVDWVHELVKLGVKNLGEARPQQLAFRAREFPSEIHWHLIGHLQRNKAEDVIAVAEMIHSVDSLRLFQHLATLGKTLRRRPRILFEVNVSGEMTKDGFSCNEFLAAWPEMQSCESLEIAGLMTMAPHDANIETVRPVFRQLRELRDKLCAGAGGKWPLNDLSMGMSGDFEIGIEEGATIIRIGSSLFDGLAATKTT